MVVIERDFKSQTKEMDKLPSIEPRTKLMGVTLGKNGKYLSQVCICHHYRT